MKKYISLAISSILIISLSTGCQTVNLRRTEIDQIRLINVIGIDRVPGDNETLEITVSSKEMKPQGSGETGQSLGQQGSFVVSAQGKTILEAIGYLYSISEKTPIMGHVEYIIIGEEAAKKGILEDLDLFFRYYEVRLNLNVIVVKNGTAQQVIGELGAEEGFIGDKIKSLFNDKWALSISDEIQLIDIMDMLNNRYASTYIPCIYLVNTKHQDTSGDRKGPKMRLDGYAIFKGTRLTGYINGRTARGFNWVRGKVVSGIWPVKDEQGKDIALEVINAKSKINPKFSDGKLKVFVEIKVSTNIAEIQGTQDIFKSSVIDGLKRQQEKIIRDDINKALSFAKENNADIFPFSDAILHKYPVKWESIKDDWDNIFPELEIHVNVKSLINRTYDIREPIRDKAGETS